MAIWSTVDRDGREVTLTEVDWAQELDEHKELVGRGDVVRATVEHPDRITRDATYAHGENFYRRIGPGPLSL